MKKSIIASVILSIFLLSCSAYNQTTEPVTGTPQKQTSTAVRQTGPTSTQVAVFTSTALPTPVKSLQYPTNTPKSSAPIPVVVEQCPKILDLSIDPSNLPAGSLVLWNPDRKVQNSVLYNIKTGRKTLLPFAGQSYINKTIAVSPDNRWIAYEAYSPSGSLLIISDSNGKVKKEIAIKSLKPLEKTLQARFSTYGLEEWLNNEQLLIGYGTGVATADTPAGSMTFDSHTLVLNPFNGQQSTLNSDFPGHAHEIDLSGSWGNFTFTRAVYDPNLQYVVYPSYTDIILRDLKNAKEIARFPELPYLSFSRPTWSKDGKSFLIELPDGDTPTSARFLYQVDQDGKLHQLTPFIQTGFEILLNFSWSPDENSVAFWMRTKADQYQLGVVNLANSKVINLCVPGDFDPSFPVNNSPVWSPDSRYLTVHSKLNRDQENGQVFIIDLNKQEAYLISETSVPVGWATP